MNQIKSAFLTLFQPKAILFGISIFLFIYVSVLEVRATQAYGCWNCGFDLRYGFLLVIASSTLLVKKHWSVIISLLASLKVVYTFGYLTLWNTELRTDSTSNLSIWMVLQDSISFSYEWNSIMFIELFIALAISIYAILFLWKSVSQKYLHI